MTQKSSSSRQAIGRQSAASQQAVARQSAGSRQAVVRQLSGSRQVVVRQSSSNGRFSKFGKTCYLFSVLFLQVSLKVGFIFMQEKVKNLIRWE